MVYNYATVFLIVTVALNAGNTAAGPIRSVHSSGVSSSISKDHHPSATVSGPIPESTRSAAQPNGSGQPDLCGGHSVKPSAPVSELPTASSALPHSSAIHSPAPISSVLPIPSGASAEPKPSSLPSGHVPGFERRLIWPLIPARHFLSGRTTVSASKSASVPVNSGASSVPGHHSAVSSVPTLSPSTLPSCGKPHGSTTLSVSILKTATPGPSSNSPLPSGFISNPPGPSASAIAVSPSAYPRPSALLDERAGNILLKGSGAASIVSSVPVPSSVSSVSIPAHSGGAPSSVLPLPSASPSISPPAACEPSASVVSSVLSSGSVPPLLSASSTFVVSTKSALPIASAVSSVLPSGSVPPLSSASETSVVSTKSALPLPSGLPHLPPRPSGIPLIE
ncbi:hypothetical protein FB451DRAFT_1174104 [Mycena latifolia]|nr:hypothetical protein FB451DRAFT_1174104 [Mycena latifolia]